MSLALRRPRGRGIEGEFRILSRPAAHGLHVCSDILLLSVRGKVERETGFEPATFRLGTTRPVRRPLRKPNWRPKGRYEATTLGPRQQPLVQ